MGVKFVAANFSSYGNNLLALVSGTTETFATVSTRKLYLPKGSYSVKRRIAVFRVDVTASPSELNFLVVL